MVTCETAWTLLAAAAAGAATFAVGGVVHLLTRPRLGPDAPWTERARETWSGHVAGQHSALAVFAAFGIASVAGGPRAAPDPFGRVLAVGLAVFLAAGPFVRARHLRALGWLDPRTARRGGFTALFLMRFPAAVCLATMAVLPARIGPLFFAVAIPAAALLFFAAAGGGVWIARRTGLVHPAPARLVALVAEAARAQGRAPPEVLLADMAMANAFALPFLGTILVTGRTAEVMTDDELRAIAAHEVSHLAEPRGATWCRLLGLPFLLGMAGSRPLLAAVGPLRWFAILAAGYLLLLQAVRHARKMEAGADADARAQDGPDPVFARALEKGYRENLTPAVRGRGLRAHPELVDRLIAAGVEPDFPRPAPPPRRIGIRSLAVVLAVALAAIFYLSVGAA